MNLRIIKKTAKDMNVTQAQVELVEYAIFSFLRERMGDGLYEGINLPHFGKFVVKEHRKKTLIERYGEDWCPRNQALFHKIRRDYERSLKQDNANSDAGENAEKEVKDLQEMPPKFNTQQVD